MKGKLCLLLLAISTMLGCAKLTARFYPVQGPLSAQTPQPVLIARISGKFTLGDMSVVLPDGELCKGRWTVVSLVSAPKATAITTAPTNSMAPVWDSVYGSGYYVSRVLGARYYAQTVVTGNRGTVLNAEMYIAVDGREVSAASYKGVAKDNRDNMYKLVVAWEQ
jgi:hypothetical protein